MSATAPNEAAVLTAFLQSPSTVSAEQAAESVHAVIAKAAGPSGAPPATVQLAQRVLVHLFKTPSLDVIPHLLPACECHIASRVLDVFVLSTAAWKAVTVAALHAVRQHTVDDSIALRILSFSMRAALSMLLRAVAFSRQPAAIAIPDVARHVKIAKFYALNAMRCAAAFATVVVIQAQLYKRFADVVTAVLRLVGLVSYMLLMCQAQLSTVFDQLKNEIAPLISATLLSVLAMLRPMFSSDDLHNANSFVSKCFQNFAADSAFEIDESVPVVPSLPRLFSILHVMRHAACDITSTESNPAEDVRFLRTLFHPVFCPILFDSLSANYEQLVTLRVSASAVPLIQVVTNAAAECLAITDVYGDLKTGRVASNQISLLIEMSAVNPLRAHLAADALTRIFTILPSAAERRVQLFTAVTSCARMAHALGSAHAHSRWIPLVARLALLSPNDDDLLLRGLGASRVGPAQPTRDMKISMSDSFALRVIASVCRHISAGQHSIAEKGSTKDAASDHESDVMGVLRKAKLDRTTLRAFVQKCIANASGDSEAAGAALELVPFVLDTMSTSLLLVNFMKKGVNASLFCAAINMLQPAYMQETAIHSTVQTSSAAVNRHGEVVCAVVAGFIARAARAMCNKGSKVELRGLSRLLQVAIETSQRANNKGNNPVASALYGATMHHAAEILSLVGSLRGNGERLALAEAQLSAVEDAQSRWQQYDMQRAKNDDGSVDLAKEATWIALEKVSCKQGSRRNVVCPKRSASAIESVRTVREGVVELLENVLGDNGGKLGEDVAVEIEGLRCMVNCVSHWAIDRA